VNSDARPRLEFAAPRLLYTMDAEGSALAETVAKRAWLSPGLAQRARQVRTDIDSQIDLAAYAFSLHWPFANMVDLSKATPAQRGRFATLAEAYAGNHIMDFSVLGDAELEHRCRLAQIRAIEAGIDSASDRAGAVLHVAGLYSDARMIPEAVAAYRSALQARPDSVEALRGLAWRLAVHTQADFHDPNQAVALAERAGSLAGGRPAVVMDTLAAAYAAAGQYDRAQAAARQALALFRESGRLDRAAQVESRLRLYAAGRPYSEPLPGP